MNCLIKFIFISLCAVSLAACTGLPEDAEEGDNQNEQPQPTPTPTPTPQPGASANGLWTGSFTEEGGGTFSVFALLYQGRLYAISEQAGTAYSGSYSANSPNLSGNLTAFQIGGGPLGMVSMDGTFEAEGNISASFSTGGESAGEITMLFDETYNQPSSLALVAGVWEFSDSGFIVSITINSDGEINGQDETGCTYSGNVRILEPEHNLYDLFVRVEACGDLTGQYVGFGGLFNNNNALQIVVENNELLFIYPFSRQ